MPYKLSASLHAHSSDVRAVASPIDSLILSVSRDKTAVTWSRPAPAAPFEHEYAVDASSKYINAVAYIPPSADAPRGYVVTGGNETVINVYPVHAPDESNYTLLGHSENVCALNASASGLIISGSWDRTAKVWRNFQQLYELRGHEQSVWAVQIVDEGEETYLTASADKTIKMWIKNKVLKTFTGHTGAVRGLALIPGVGFASCSNDGEIRVWTSEGDTLFTLSGHTSFVYTLSVLLSGEIVSGGEDRTVRVWRDEECVQTIVHPATSVWSVSSMPNGDIVTGSSDGVVRIFSAAEERWASADELKQYDAQVASQALPSQQVGDVKKTDLPGLEALSTPGKKPGEVKMIRNSSDGVEAHQWDSATMSWQKIGDVVDAVGSGRKQLHDGKEYDYVFDVDIKDGVPPLKLPYNANENPYIAAQRFLIANELPMSYLDQVVQFIETNASGVTLSAGNEFVDPFTGASRYQASSGSRPAGGASTYSDPFTGASRYQAVAPGPSAPSGSGDPFTGGSRYTPASSLAPTPPVQSTASARSLSVIPVNTFLSFKQGNVSAMRGKICELDDAFRNEISTLAMAMYPQESNRFEEAYVFLRQALTSPNNITAPPLRGIHLDAIVQVLERWLPSTRFPVIDLARLVSGYCPSSYADPTVAWQFFSSLLQAAEWDSPWETPMQKSRETNVLLTLRALANTFQEGSQTPAGEWVGDLLKGIGKAPYDVLKKNHRVTLATLLFKPGPFNCQRRTLGSDKLERNDAETAYRALVALGNILFAIKSQGGSITPAQAAELRKELPALTAKFPEERIGSVVKDVESLL
ncbi:phospholipase A-2-activating protein [Phellopilus nigrolimitatus]|nr:phospholipase A-2-activating protein [Phellopilus nigrolimitatus]